jgi:hypothetical protein
MTTVIIVHEIGGTKDEAWSVVDNNTKTVLGYFPFKEDALDYCEENNLIVSDIRSF